MIEPIGLEQIVTDLQPRGLSAKQRTGKKKVVFYVLGPKMYGAK
jgi:hypothetical protein